MGREDRNGRRRARLALVSLTVVAGLVGCAPKTFLKAPPAAADRASTPDLLSYLVEQASEYRMARAEAEAALARAQRLMGAPDRQATHADPLAPARTGAVRLAGAIGYREAMADIENLDREWRLLLRDMLGNAPSAADFEVRATALGVTADEFALYAVFFEATPMDSGDLMFAGEGSPAGTRRPAGSDAVVVYDGSRRGWERNGPTLVRYPNGSVHEGTYGNGQRQGQWILTHAGGMVEQGWYVDGEQQGHWIATFPGGGVEEGLMVDGQRQGQWIFTYPDGTVMQGPMVSGREQGHWLVTLADGTILQGPMVNGLKQGHWIVTAPDGSVMEGPMVDGVMHGDWIVTDTDGSSRFARFERGVRRP